MRHMINIIYLVVWNHGIIVIIIIDNMLDYHYGILLDTVVNDDYYNDE